MKKLDIKWGASLKSKGWDGLNNAAINVFNSHVINSFVREMFQNSNDARNLSLPIDPTTGKRPPLILSINYKKFKREQFPDFDGFIKIFASIKNSKPNEGHLEFFKNGEKALGDRNSINFFVYEDFNTTGLDGSDEDANKSFNACVLSEGLTVKSSDTAGGSYGIGKNAIFGFSKLRTVFYASRNLKGEYIFQGIAKLASYFDSDKKTRESRIFCGDGDNWRSVRDFDKMPGAFCEVFKREQPGLSQFAVCPSDNVNWVEQFARAILRNYWLLIYEGDLIIDLKKDDDLIETISKKNLEALLMKYFDTTTYKPERDLEPSGNPLEFFRTLVSGNVVSAKLDLLGNVKFYYRELENNKSNRIAYVRNGMVVFSEAAWGFGSINYCGVFICESDEGNRILRLMEPPTHNSFDSERLNEKTDRYSSKQGEKILEDIREIIDNSLQQILDKYKQPVEDIPWLDELLSSLSGAASLGSGLRTNSATQIETPERMGVNINTTLVFDSLQKDSLINYEHGNVDGTGSGDAPGPGGGNRGGGRGNGNGFGGGTSGSRNSKKTNVKSRVFRTGVQKNIGEKKTSEYKIYMNSSVAIPASDILLTQKGDTGSVVSFELFEVTDEAGTAIDFQPEKNNDGDVTSYRIKSITAPGQYLIYVGEAYKSSFKLNTAR